MPHLYFKVVMNKLLKKVESKSSKTCRWNEDADRPEASPAEEDAERRC